MATMLESAQTPTRPDRNKEMAAMLKSGQTPPVKQTTTNTNGTAKCTVPTTAAPMQDSIGAVTGINDQATTA